MKWNQLTELHSTVPHSLAFSTCDLVKLRTHDHADHTFRGPCVSTCYTLRDLYLHCLQISLFFCVCMSYQCLLKTKWAFIWWHQQHGQIRCSLFIRRAPPQQCAIHHGQKYPCGSCGRNGVSPSPVFGNLGHSCRPCNTSKLAPALLATIWEPLENNVSDSRPQKRAFVEVQLSSRDV